MICKETNISFTPVGTAIDAGDSRDFSVSLFINRTGLIADTLFLIFNSPCQDTLQILFSATGIEGSLEFPTDVNYAAIAPCDERDDTLRFVNTGDNELKIIEMILSGVNSGNFSFNDNVSIPYTLQPNDTLKRIVKFSGLYGSNGIRSATLTTKINVNLKDTVLTTNLTGEINMDFKSIPSRVDFTGVVVSTTSNIIIKLKNNGKTLIDIQSILPFADNVVFTTTPSDIKRQLIAGEEITLTVNCTPQSVTNYYDTLRISYKSGMCDSVLLVPVSARSTPTKDITIWIPELSEVSANLNGYHIPVYAQITNDADTLKNVSFEATVGYNTTVFWLEGITRGIVKSHTSTNNISSVRIAVDNITITSTDTTVFELTGSTLLGEVDSTDLTWSNFQWTAGGEKIGSQILKNGKIKVKTCPEGGKRLIKYGVPFNFTITYPSNLLNTIDVQVNTLEAGTHRIEIINLQGKKVYETSWNAQFGEVNKFEFRIDLSEFSTGMYIIILKSPERIKTAKVMVY